MSRSSAPDTPIFRGILVFEGKNGPETIVYGPYQHVSPVKAALTKWKRENDRRMPFTYYSVKDKMTYEEYYQNVRPEPLTILDEYIEQASDWKRLEK